MAPGGPAGAGEDWELEPGWDPQELFADTEDVSALVYQAVYEAGALARPEGVDIDLFIDAPPGGDRMYQWRVSFPASAEFALCSPYREEYEQIGWYEEDGPRAKGSATALAILREAEGVGNRILDAHARTIGRVPSVRPRPRARRAAVPGASPRPGLSR